MFDWVFFFYFNKKISGNTFAVFVNMERFVLIAVIVATLASLKECPTCTKALVSSNLEDNRNLLCFFKVYDSAEKIFWGLNALSPFYLENVKQLEDAFITDFSIPSTPKVAWLERNSWVSCKPFLFHSKSALIFHSSSCKLFIYELEFIMV